MEDERLKDLRQFSTKWLNEHIIHLKYEISIETSEYVKGIFNKEIELVKKVIKEKEKEK